jgi:GT2 family glycosyltransferase
MSKHEGVMIGYVRPLMVHGEFMEALFVEANRAKAKVHGMWSEPYVDAARNRVVEFFMASDCEWFLSVDTDIILPDLVVQRLMARRQSLVGALIYVDADPIFPQIYSKIADFGFGGMGQYVVNEAWNPGELVKADATGAGCLLIHREVFDKIPEGSQYRWFEHEREGQQMFGEDFTFCRRARQVGFQLYIDTAVHAKHIKTRYI